MFRRPVTRRWSGSLPWPRSFSEILRYLGVAFSIGAGAALGLNAYESYRARQAILEAFPIGYEFPNCRTVEARGLAPLQSYERGYSVHMDRDGDGIACEPYR